MNKRKFEGAYKYKCKFKKKWITEEPFFNVLRENQNNPHSCHCTICDKDADCSHQGKADIKRHVNGNTRVSKSEALRRATKASNHVTDFFTSESSADQVINAELLVTDFLVEHNLPMAVADSLGPLFTKAFPDSKIAKQYHCGATKTSYIINDALAPYFLQKTVESMKTKPFTLSTDGSNDTGLAKMNPLTLTIFDISRSNGVTTDFLDLCNTRQSTAQAIFDKIDDVLNSHNLPWNNCVGFSVDNTNVNVGVHNSVMSRVLEKNPAVCFVGCPCHKVNNAAKKGGEEFSLLSGFNVDDFLVDLYFWFEYSSTRKKQA